MRLTACLICASALLGAQAPAGPKPAEKVRLTPLRVSPAASLTQDVGISSIRIAYHRPAVKGRVIWGGLVPYGEAWRTGANEATTFTFSDACKVAGHDVPAGTYAFFAVPSPGRWTLILSRKADQWGSFSYDPKDDFLRFEVAPENVPYQEWLDYRIRLTGEDSVRVELSWERLQVGFPVSFDTKAVYWKHLEARLAAAPDSDWVPWFQAADYCQKHQVHADLASAWIEKSLRANPVFWNQECKARILRWSGRGAEAVAWMDRAVTTAGALPDDQRPPKEWFKDREKELAAWKAEGPRP